MRTIFCLYYIEGYVWAHNFFISITSINQELSFYSSKDALLLNERYAFAL